MLIIEDILSGKMILKNKKVVVVGFGLIGFEIVYYFVENNNDVSIFEMADEIGLGVYF